MWLRQRDLAAFWLFWSNFYFDECVGSETIAVKRMALREPVPNAALSLTYKVEIALDSQMSKFANQVGDGVFVTRATAMLKNGKRVGGRGNVSAFLNIIPPN